MFAPNVHGDQAVCIEANGPGSGLAGEVAPGPLITAHLRASPLFEKSGGRAAPVDGVTLPMMAADEARLKLLIPIAEQVTAITRMKIKLVKFTRRKRYGTSNDCHLARPTDLSKRSQGH